MSLYARGGKRLTDLTLGSAALLIFSPLVALVALMVRTRLGSPVLYRQERPGRDGRLFTIYKFRTMQDRRDGEGRLLPDAERLTHFGKLLRRFSLDELPELWNVIRGDMSIVGPRPLLVEYLDRYTPEQARRHEVRPGITGWAQVSGRNRVDFEERFRLDVWYVDHLSFTLDAKILALTAWKVLSGEGVAAEGHATMPRFRDQKGE